MAESIEFMPEVAKATEGVWNPLDDSVSRTSLEQVAQEVIDSEKSRIRR